MKLSRGDIPPNATDPVPLHSFRFRPFLALRTLWDGLRMSDLLQPLSNRLPVLVSNRLISPSYKHRLADWLRTCFACDS